MARGSLSLNVRFVGGWVGSRMGTDVSHHALLPWLPKSISLASVLTQEAGLDGPLA